MGVSLLYHLAKFGWTDVVLIEKNELTAGSTWHAAGLCTHFAHNPTIMEMRATSIRLYRDILPKETGQSVGFHASGALRVTRSRDRMDEFRHVRGIGSFVGYDFEILTPAELKEIYPLCQTDGLLGAIYEPKDGHVDPTLATNAMASVARENGAEIYRHTQVTAIRRLPSGEWEIQTTKGTIKAEHIVNAAGTWCREIGTMMGIDLPVVPMLHQYLVTDRIGAVAERIATGAPELPIIRDPEESWYLRQERDGFIVGPYEKAAHPWSVDGVPPEFGMELLPPDIDRVEHIIAMAIDRVPSLGEGGIKTVVNGPITFTPDGNPLVGPAFDLTNAWLLTGSSMGVMEGGGAGSFLAQWMIGGSPPTDPLAIDSRRFGGYADRSYRLDKAIECFGLQFGIHYPYEERPAGRPRRTTPLLDEQVAAGAVLGCAYGWERPNWFARETIDTKPEELTFRRPGWFDAVRDECLAVTEKVGVCDLSAFSKFDVTGIDAEKFINSLGANSAPVGDGRIRLTHALTPAGGVASEFTVTRFAANHFYLTSAAAAERHDMDLLRSRAVPYGDLKIENRTEQLGILGVMGPRSRDLLGRITAQSLKNADFPWLTAQRITVAGIPVRMLRVSYIGELGWELHAEMRHLRALYDAILATGKDLGIRPFGSYAINAMRFEKGYRAWGADLTTERTPIESGLGFLVKPEGREFIGRSNLLKRLESPDAWKMELIEIEDSGSDPFYSHTIFQNEMPVGIVTSAGFGHRINKRLALAFFKPKADLNSKFQVEILGQKVGASVLAEAPFDPKNRRMIGAD